jgi:hypothetical protein
MRFGMNAFLTPHDSGPIYKETVMGRWPVEPWNTGSTLFFLILVLYWFFKIRKDWREHKLIAITIFFIGVGFVGGFVYHSTRTSLLWLLLDWVPIIINSNIASLYFWKILLKKWKYAIIAAYIPLIASVPLYTSNRFNSIIPMSLGYAAIFFSVALPIILYARKKHYQHAWMLVASATSIVIAVLLRTFDSYPIMDIFPMGTHFLWHSLGALTCHFLILFVYTSQNHHTD